MSHWPLLSLLIWVPIAGAIPVLFAGQNRPSTARWLTLLISLVTFILSLALLFGYNYNSGAMQFVESHAWLPAIHSRYGLGVDGISIALIILTSFTNVLVVVGAWEVIRDKVHQYMAAMLVLTGLMIGIFAATDALLFYVFFEAMLIPMFIIIGVWGGPRRIYATIKFFLFTMFGSIFMLLALIFLYLKTGNFSIAAMQHVPLTMTEQTWIFFSFLIAFAVKVPMVPVHTWLPDAHVEAPTGGSVVLAAVMLKIGGYGFIRFALPITPDAADHFAWLVITLSLIAIIYIGYVALVQEDMKKLVAYSSVAHMGFVTLGLFIVFILIRDGSVDMAKLGIQGSMVQMISHGFISGAMFTSIGVMYDRMHTRMIKDYGGLANVMPWFALFMVFFGLANAGLPGTSGFVGEFMVIIASFHASPWIGLAAAFTLVIGAGYTLWLIKRVVWGEVRSPEVAAMKDISAREIFVLASFALLVLWLGFWPEPLVHLIHAPITELVHTLGHSKL